MYFFVIFTWLIGVCFATIGTLVFLGDRSIKKELAEEETEQLISLQIHGSRVMLTAAEYEAHLEDTAAPGDDCFSKF